MIRLPFRRRAEGATEYVVILGLVSTCVIVGMFRFGGKIQETLETAEFCINCEPKAGTDGETPADSGYGNDDETRENEDEETRDGPLPWYNDPGSSFYWVAQLIRWFGGAPHFMDLMFPSRV